MTDLSELKGLTEQVSAKIETKHAEFDAKLRKLEAMQNRLATGGGVDADFAEESKAIDAWARTGEIESKALSIVSDGQGVVVRGDWSDRIFKLVRETSPIRAVANVMRTSTQTLEVLVDRGEPGSAWVAETGARNATSESFLTRHPISTHEHYAYPAITNHLLADAEFDVEGWLQGKIGRRFGRQEASSFMTGDGVGQPRGILDYDFVADAGFTWGANPAEYEIGSHYAGGVNIDVDDLLEVMGLLKAVYLPRAGWMMTRAMRTIIRKLKDQNARPLLQPAASGVQDGFSDTLLGYPVYLAEDMPTPETDAVGLLFGDFGEAYTVVDRMGIQVIRDPFTQPGFVKYYVSKRVGGAMTNPEAIKGLILGAEPE